MVTTTVTVLTKRKCYKPLKEIMAIRCLGDKVLLTLDNHFDIPNYPKIKGDIVGEINNLRICSDKSRIIGDAHLYDASIGEIDSVVEVDGVPPSGVVLLVKLK